MTFRHINWLSELKVFWIAYSFPSLHISVRHSLPYEFSTSPDFWTTHPKLIFYLYKLYACTSYSTVRSSKMLTPTETNSLHMTTLSKNWHLRDFSPCFIFAIGFLVDIFRWQLMLGFWLFFFFLLSHIEDEVVVNWWTSLQSFFPWQRNNDNCTIHTTSYTIHINYTWQRSKAVSKNSSQQFQWQFHGICHLKEKFTF